MTPISNRSEHSIFGEPCHVPHSQGVPLRADLLEVAVVHRYDIEPFVRETRVTG